MEHCQTDGVRGGTAGGSGAECDGVGLVNRVAVYACTVLITGETGVGKEVTARRLHDRGRRSAGPFVAVDCTTLTESLFESQLFGHERGAFTGADRATEGFVRAADGGTLFLDEVGELPLGAQAKLLRVLQERAVVAVGSTAPRPVDVRVIAATHRDLESMVDEGTFRADLYYRLNVVRIALPSLREQPERVGELAEGFLHELSEMYDEPRKRLSPAAWRTLVAHSWPGNIRELKHAIEHAWVMAEGAQVETRHLPSRVLERRGPGVRGERGIVALRTAEADLVRRALDATGWNRSAAAELLDIDRRRWVGWWNGTAWFPSKPGHLDPPGMTCDARLTAGVAVFGVGVARRNGPVGVGMVHGGARHCVAACCALGTRDRRAGMERAGGVDAWGREWP